MGLAGALARHVIPPKLTRNGFGQWFHNIQAIRTMKHSDQHRVSLSNSSFKAQAFISTCRHSERQTECTRAAQFQTRQSSSTEETWTQSPVPNPEAIFNSYSLEIRNYFLQQCPWNINNIPVQVLCKGAVDQTSWICLFLLFCLVWVSFWFCLVSFWFFLTYWFLVVFISHI